jgi:hypothetical protein
MKCIKIGTQDVLRVSDDMAYTAVSLGVSVRYATKQEWKEDGRQYNVSPQLMRQIRISKG